MRSLAIAFLVWCSFLFPPAKIWATVLYVDANGINPVPPYADWTTAATSIQAAVDASSEGDTILVTNGVYQTGGQIVTGSLQSRVFVSKALTVQSVNGPAVTVIAGHQVSGVTNGDGAIRCVYLTNNATLIGFTLTNGATRGINAGSSEKLGGGIYCRSSSSVVSNCVIVGNASLLQGGGVYQGTLYNCTLIGNISTNGGGAYSSSLTNCILAGNRAFSSGGGANSATLTHCTLLTNSASVSGGGAYSGALTNCTLSGNSSRSGGGANAGALVNCALTTNSASLSGGGANGGTLTSCTLTGNAAGSGGGANSAAVISSVFSGNTATNAGGGVNGGTATNCIFTFNSVLAGNGGGANSATVLNCTLMNNSAFTTPGMASWQAGNGGGAYSGTLNSCALARNSAIAGGATYFSTLNNCTLVGNVASVSGGGATSATLNNCIVYYNSAAFGANYDGAALNFCCTTPLPAGGNGNFSLEPLLSDDFHLSAVSPCRGVGSAGYANGKDIDGESWASVPSVGCDEFNAVTAAGALGVSFRADYTNAAIGAPLNFTASVTGVATGSSWDFGDGTVLNNRSYASHAWTVGGDYVITFRAFNSDHPTGVSATMTVHVVMQPVHYVAVNSPSPVAPYITWATAATNIQDAINAATVSGARVVVSNGVYATGGKVMYGALSNRVAVTKPLVVQSVNGPAATVIRGNGVLGDGAVRCVYLTNGASLAGFTLTNGATRTSGEENLEQSGGGAWCASPSVIVSNCVVSGNLAWLYGGGIFGGMWVNSQVAGDVSYNFGGGAYLCSMTNCSLFNNVATNGGGGAYYGNLTACTLTGNTAPNGGGANSTTLNNCLVTSNSASSGGGVYSGDLWNCSLSNNLAVFLGGGSYSAVLNNCLLSGNAASNNYNPFVTGDGGNAGGGAYGGSLTNCALNNNIAGGLGDGGGAYNATLKNCQLTNNFATVLGGGARSCTVIDCALVSNSVPLSSYDFNGVAIGPAGGGTFLSSLSNCVLLGNSASDGGGAHTATLDNCTLRGNYSASNGGGADGCTLNNCSIVGNSALTAGGAGGGTLNNCTVVSNSATAGFAGVYGGTIYNSILYYNAIADGTPTNFDNFSNATINASCTTPLPSSGSGNFTNAPLFANLAAGDLRLQSNSPCIDAGNNSYIIGSADLDGRLRVVNGMIDVGAYEFQGTGIEPFISWLWQYGLPTDGSADYMDSDGTGLNNWQKWIAGLNPTNSTSVLAMFPPVTAHPKGLTVSWQSVTNRTYFLQRSTNLTFQPNFTSIQSNLLGQIGTTSYVDTNALGFGPFFYRVGVQW